MDSQTRYKQSYGLYLATRTFMTTAAASSPSLALTKTPAPFDVQLPHGDPRLYSIPEMVSPLATPSLHSHQPPWARPTPKRTDPCGSPVSFSLPSLPPFRDPTASGISPMLHCKPSLRADPTLARCPSSQGRPSNGLESEFWDFVLRSLPPISSLCLLGGPSSP